MSILSFDDPARIAEEEAYAASLPSVRYPAIGDAWHLVVKAFDAFEEHENVTEGQELARALCASAAKLLAAYDAAAELERANPVA